MSLSAPIYYTIKHCPPQSTSAYFNNLFAIFAILLDNFDVGAYNISYNGAGAGGPAAAAHRHTDGGLGCENATPLRDVSALRTRMGMDLCIEYSEAADKLTMTAMYGGGRFNPFESDNELSLLMVNKLAQSTEFAYTDRNTVRLVL